MRFMKIKIFKCDNKHIFNERFYLNQWFETVKPYKKRLQISTLRLPTKIMAKLGRAKPNFGNLGRALRACANSCYTWPKHTNTDTQLSQKHVLNKRSKQLLWYPFMFLSDCLLGKVVYPILPNKKFDGHKQLKQIHAEPNKYQK